MESRCQLCPWALFVLLAAPQLLGAQQACSHGACYPPSGDLLLGRAHHLRASSTCGLTKPETYCTPHGEWSMKCCRCDSRLPHTYNGHRVGNVLSSAGRARWWQSQNGVERVSLQLDLDQTFQLGSVVLHFRSPLPAAMLIERSTDFGRTWQVYQYLASDCSTAFPHVPRGSPESWQDTRCQALQGHPMHGGKVKFSVQDLASTITSSHSQAINKLGPFTNLRINFTELPHIPRQGYHSPSTFYAVTEMQVLGSCFCHGHADRCAPSGEQHNMVHGHCVCQHNTAGPHCERCADLYNALPWAPAEDNDPHECQRCNCNGHSSSCHFDPELYRASGGVSGGVCDDCQHNTEGNNCEHCKSNYFRNQQQDLTHPEACLPCECDPDGTVPGSVCDPVTGRCVCKENVQGDRCHLCKPGFTQLANPNPLGCRRCTCNALGTRQDMPCDDETGRCFCLPNVVGNDCDQCAAEHWDMGSRQGCQPCDCHPRGSHSPHCNQFTGQCPCREGFTGRTCSAMQEQLCPDRHYRDVRLGCTECDCDFQGTEQVGCDKTTGQCLCRPGVTGHRCDQCQRGHCSSTYPECQLCHPCFQTYDGDIQRLRLRQAGLSNSTSQLPVGTGGSHLGPRLAQAERNVQQAQGILGQSSVTEQSLAQVGNALAAIREQVRGINPDFRFLDDTASLSRELEALNSSLFITNAQYQSKKTQFENSLSMDLSGAFKTIQSAYQTSSNASSLVAGASGLLAESRESRRSAEGLEGGLAETTSRLLALKGDMASSPNLTPVINKVCGGFRVEMCTPGHCQGLLCPRDNSSACRAGQPCRGIFPLARGALAAAGEASREFGSLSTRLRETAQLIKTTEMSASQIQSNTRRLVEQLGVTRTQIEGDVRRIRQFIQRLRNFLSDKDTDPATVQEISESVLSLHLPTDAAAVLRKMNEIQKLATQLQCPEDILAQTAEDIAKAKQLQQEAEQARNRAKAVEGNVDEVVGNLQRANTMLLEAQGALRGSGSSLRFIRERVDEIEAVLGPAEKNVAAIGAQLDGLMGRLERLQRGADQNRLRATDTRHTAETAGEQARSAQQAFEQVKQLYSELKGRMEQSPALGEQGSRVQSIGREAQALFEETLGIMLRMETLETEIQESNKAFMSKQSRLLGLEEQVGRIRDAIKKRVAYYESCS